MIRLLGSTFSFMNDNIEADEQLGMTCIRMRPICLPSFSTAVMSIGQQNVYRFRLKLRVAVFQISNFESIIIFSKKKAKLVLSIRIARFHPLGETWNSTRLMRNTITSDQISDHQQSWGYEEGPWKGPGRPLLMVADF